MVVATILAIALDLVAIGDAVASLPDHLPRRRAHLRDQLPAWLKANGMRLAGPGGDCGVFHRVLRSTDGFWEDEWNTTVLN